MPREMIEAVGNKNILVDMKGRGDSLGEHIDDVIVGVRTIVEFGSERVLPLLRRYLARRIRRVKDKSLELELPDARNARPYLEGQVSVRFVGIGTLDETDLRVEVRPGLPAFNDSFDPVRAVGQRGANVAVSTRSSGGLCSRHVRAHEPVLEKNKPRIHTARLIEAVEDVARSLVDSHDPDIRT